METKLDPAAEDTQLDCDLMTQPILKQETQQLYKINTNQTIDSSLPDIHLNLANTNQHPLPEITQKRQNKLQSKQYGFGGTQLNKLNERKTLNEIHSNVAA